MLRPSLAMLALAALAACSEGEAQPAESGERPPPTVTVAQPVVKEIVEDDEFVGRFEAVAAVEVRARVGGYLQEVHFEDGQMVQAGQLLFTIDQEPFDWAVRRAEAQARVDDSQLTYAIEELDRASRLVQNGNISESVVDERREAYLSAQASAEASRAAVEQARVDLGYTEIRAPIGGRIGEDRVNPGNLVQADQTVLTTIVAQDPIHFYFDIDERYFLAYARDARARGVSLQEGGGGLEVRVTLNDDDIPPRAGRLDFAENRLDEETGTMRVRAILPNKDGVLQPGLFGRVNVPGSLPYEGVLIPDEAIFADQNRRLVYVVDDENAVSAREVRPGPRIDGYRVIRDGLDGSETIVVEGQQSTGPGGVVTPDPVELPPVAES